MADGITTNDFIHGVMRITISFLGCFLNGWVGYLFYLSKRSTAFKSNLLMTNLMFSNLVFSALSLVCYSYHVFSQTSWSFVLCQATGFCIQSLSGVSFLSLVCQVIDPFRIAVLRLPPLSTKQLWLLVALIWISMGVLVPLTPYYTGTNYTLLQSKTWCYVNLYSVRPLAKIIMILWVVSLFTTVIATGIAYLIIWRYLPKKVATQECGDRAQNFDMHTLMAKQGAAVFGALILFWLWPIMFLFLRLVDVPQRSDWEDMIFGVLVAFSHLSNSTILLIVNNDLRKRASDAFFSSIRKRSTSSTRISASIRISEVTRQ